MTRIKTVDLATTSGAYYAPATLAPANTEIMHVSGQPGSTSGGIVPADYESQIQLALTNLRKVMIIGGATVKDILKLTILIVNYDKTQRKHTRHIQKFLEGHRPAITLVPVTQLAAPNWLFEIDAVIALPSTSPSVPLQLTIDSAEKTLDVIIVGAGLAGLTAATELQRAGHSFIVLEARDRVGGKTWSQVLPNGEQGVIDVGAAWINSTNQSRMYALAKRFGAEILEQNTTGKCVLQDADGNCSTFEYGELPKFDIAIARDVARIRDMVEADCQTLDPARPQNAEWDSMTFEAYLRARGASAEAIATATVWTRAMLGQDPKDISALYFLTYCRSGGGLLQMRSDRLGGGQHLRIRQGTQLMAIGLSKELPNGTVGLSTPVSSITQSGINSDVEVVTTNQKKYRARKVITTVPSPVLKTILFTPDLPPSKKLWSESSTYGYYTKAMMTFREPFWVEKGYCGLTQSFTGPASVIRDTSSLPDQKYVLTCFMSSDLGRAWAALSTPEREQALIKQIGQLFQSGLEASRDFISMVTYEWTSDPYSGWGCPCPSLASGVMDSLGGNGLREPFGNLHFAGTETAINWRGYMEGAVESGERAASEVIKELTTVLARL
ncbi:flavin-containing amine oxidase, putative [Talaromyces stipitatus ATCC 10500]|uniref:Amine oxidase n=1 Tax=Talaromyces stipitatus (strain ATCC 10500 / CBS 375.48 / QM 6759 / NRRL 1006) TaxID=441959 RepID=B8MFJ9_TALSN|nr:flavin-containing amine oxidase, putative [Talaromyces stipitatus ATCC 10500]EED16989.1 flavin-containing amine oxidase, putative [Talaromyces stipitatus ATCC 10500]